MMRPKLGIIAGGGVLPHQVIKACKEDRRDFFVIAFEGQTPQEDFQHVPSKRMRLGAVGTIIKCLKSKGCKELVFVGNIIKPNFKDLMPDFWTSKFFARTGGFNLGDNSILSSLVHDLEMREGFKIIGIHQLIPNLLVKTGVYGKHQPSLRDYHDIKIGVRSALKLSEKDKGQACIVRNGSVIGLENRSGTKSLLKQITPETPPNGVLVKTKEPRQEYRIDLPTIGPKTIEETISAGLRGIAMEAGRALIIDQKSTIRRADKLNIFVVGLNPNG